MPFKDPATKAAYNRQYRLVNLEASRAYHREWFTRHWHESAEFRERNRTKIDRKAHAAQQRVYHALKRGEIERPATCERCGVEAFIEAAHVNYDEPLAIRWLCRPCHRLWDAALPKGGLVKVA